MGAGVVRSALPPPVAAATDTHDEPRDARVVREILRSAGLREGDYDPAVVHQFLIVAYRYAGDVLGDALAYAEHAGRASLEADDVRLAVQSNAMFSAQPPTREVILNMAHSRNDIPLPKFSAPPGSSSLPPHQDTLRQNHLCISRVKPTLDQIEEIEEEEEDKGEDNSNPDQAASLNSKNEQDQSGSEKHRRPKIKVSSRLNAMAAAVARRCRMNS